jgi:hypothetical protein
MILEESKGKRYGRENEAQQRQGRKDDNDA